MTRQHGFSLIELMIASTISLLMIGALGALMVSTRTANTNLEELASLQEDARYAFMALGRDIRMAGYTGGRPMPSSEEAGGTSLQELWLPGLESDSPGLDLHPEFIAGGKTLSPPLQGYDGSGDETPDKLFVVRADTDHPFKLESPCDTSGPRMRKVECQSAGFPRKHEYWIESSPKNANVFAVESISPENGCGTTTPSTLTLTLEEKDTGNECPANLTNTETLRVYRLLARIYFIGDAEDPENIINPACKTSLKVSQIFTKQPDDDDEAVDYEVTYELIEGVSNMKIRYGVDDDGDGSIEDYQTASTLDKNPADWGHVKSVRITLEMCSASNHDLDDTTFTQTIAIRNRLGGIDDEPTPTP
ncbi:PilW family protein [Marichromatium bheemlicum]|uniref:Prepilin-type N-terminal cleavage/methylation domain-containing protein n=1 Tax=Marichromatium bheemlicum TaxID=365339 RepID=A0ABX1I487_9GAMM|nr:PilW family protein [Marichromatium bheemlicum]NKN31669.1 prepilin-type N-terminal cleavage/methylation domain-containing protein [Marichromatium bheemlicum]